MSGQPEQVHGPVPVQYHQFRISDEAGPAGPDLPSNSNGLVAVQDGVVAVLTGIHTGDVDVTVALHSEAPGPGDGAWEEIVEVSLHSAAGDLVIRGLMSDLEEELPTLSFNGPGVYRLRIHARGRDSAIDDAPDEITEWYLIQVWAAPFGDVAVLRQTDAYGLSVRAE
ncbi:hypothetical protein [Streptomyces sp. MMG1121]|uniref:hypothetical protein n=1 Tax=Streptomyces sp. MMG1121 TaxID=1415544 RepID=UPI000AC6860B|nr:hypothetical protein [Streptomyces sp. MMG1121]